MRTVEHEFEAVEEELKRARSLYETNELNSSCVAMTNVENISHRLFNRIYDLAYPSKKNERG